MKSIIKIVFGLLSLLIALIAIGLGYLKGNDTARQKLFAGAMNTFSDENDTAIMSLRCDEILSHTSIHGHVLEIGTGTGINFACLHNNTRIIDYIGIEPNVHMHSYMEATIQRWNIPFKVQLSSVSATAMTNVESNSIDTIIMTFVLCSIPAPFDEQLLIEAHRVLKPSGTFHLLEHVLSEPNVKPMSNFFQKFIEPVWVIIGDGCRFKPIANYLDKMKTLYSKVDYQNIEVPVPLFLIKDAIKGVLTK